ncbi:MAG: hypothetical protein VYA34_07185 [Myxococcota bacterium]|nr:hypothetical protein [Myxococcota bacterium]
MKSSFFSIQILFLGVLFSQPTLATDKTESSKPMATLKLRTQSTDPSSPQPIEEANTFEENLFGGGQEESTDIDQRLEDALAEKENTTTIGGYLYLQSHLKGNEASTLRNIPFQFPALLDLYTDARPSPTVRAYARARLRHQFSKPALVFLGVNPSQQSAQTKIVLDQLWLKFSWQDTLYFTMGQQAIRWGTGRFWNPTDFLQNQIRDPLAVFDDRTGIPLLKIHFPIESLGWNLYSILNFADIEAPKDLGAALRAELLLGTTEIAISASFKHAGPTQYGFQFSAGLFDFDLYGEFAYQTNLNRNLYKGNFNLTKLEFPTTVSKSGEWEIQALAGLEYALKLNDKDTLTFGVEYFYNQWGYNDPALYPWLLIHSAFRPLYLGEHYLAATAVLPQPGALTNTTFILSSLLNLSDQSGLARLDIRTNIDTFIQLSFYTTSYFGKLGEFNFSISTPPIPQIPVLTAGLDIPSPIFDAGVGLSLNL